MKVQFLCLAGLMLASIAENADASFIESATGLANPASTITFEGNVLPANTALTSQYAAQGVTFSNMYYNPLDYSGSGYPNLSGHTIANWYEMSPGVYPIFNPFSIYFTTNQTSAAFALVANGGDAVTFMAYLSGVLVETATVPIPGSVFGGRFKADNFYGFSGITFDEIRMSITNNVNGASIIDNIQLGTAPVPEPSSVVMLGLGAIGMAFARRKRKQ